MPASRSFAATVAAWMRALGQISACGDCSVKPLVSSLTGWLRFAVGLDASGGMFCSKELVFILHYASVKVSLWLVDGRAGGRARRGGLSGLVASA